MLGPQFLVVLNFDLGHDFKTRLKAHGLAGMRVQVGHPRLRDRNESEAISFFAEIPGYQRIDNIVLNILGKTLTNNGCGNVAQPEARNARHLPVFLDYGIALARNLFGRNFDFNFAFRAGRSFGCAHCLPFGSLMARKYWFPQYKAKLGQTGSFRGGSIVAVPAPDLQPLAVLRRDFNGSIPAIMMELCGTVGEGILTAQIILDPGKSIGHIAELEWLECATAGGI